MKNILLIIICLIFTVTVKSQNIDELKTRLAIAEIEIADIKLQLEIAAQDEADSVTSQVVEESELLKRFKAYLDDNKDYLYIYKKFTKNDLKAIALEVGAPTSGIKKTIALSIQNKLQ